MSPDVNIIIPSFDFLGTILQCFTNPLFIPQTSKRSEKKPKVITAEKISSNILQVNKHSFYSRSSDQEQRIKMVSRTTEGNKSLTRQTLYLSGKK